MNCDETRMNPRKIFQTIAVSVSVLCLAACESIPSNAFRIPESSLSTRQMQTREYAELDDDTILSASVAVLQDMGYVIDEVEVELGVLSASKRANATNKLEAFGTMTVDAMQCVFTLMLACNGKRYQGIDDVQDIRLTLIAGSRQLGSDVPVRITIQRIIWDKAGRLSQQETITDPSVYDSMFAKLSKAVFLEKEVAWTD